MHLSEDDPDAERLEQVGRQDPAAVRASPHRSSR